MKEMEILGANIRRYRLLRDLKQTELAWKIGLSGEYMSKIEKAQQPNVGSKFLIRICRELNIELFQLFMEDPEAVYIKFVVSEQNLKSLERLLDKIPKRMDFSFKLDKGEPIFYHREDCKCKKCREKKGDKK